MKFRQRYLCLLIGLVFLGQPLLAQYTVVNYEFEKNWFNQGEPLPAESYMMLSGNTINMASLVEVSIYGNLDKTPLYKTNWLRAPNNSGSQFDIPINYKLRGSSDYTFQVDYFVSVTNPEKDEVRTVLASRLESYIDQMVELSDQNIRLRKNPKLILEDLNMVVSSSLVQYRNRNGLEFNGFSTLILQQVERLEDIKLKKAFLYVGAKDDEETENMKFRMVEELLANIKLSVISEANQYINNELLVLSFSKQILKYPTENTMNFLPVNIGYMGIYEKGNLKNLSYGTAPSIGISFPLGNSAFASPFWSNTSFSMGVVINKVNMTSGTSYSGPVIGVPLYFGLGYRVLKMIRINGGVTLLQEGAGSGLDVDLNALYLRPYIGASFEFKLWAGLNQ